MSALIEENPNLFSILRRSGLGASDASTVLQINKWNKLEDLIEEKKTTELTERELAIGNLENVRRGRDLEPIILSKFEKAMGIEVAKPDPMYRIKHLPYLTINFDGVVDFGDNVLIPVEAKYVSTYGGKYWDQSKAIKSLAEGNRIAIGKRNSIAEYLTEVCGMYGIPDYYYTQIQQQMLGLDAPFGYFSVIFDKGWEHKVFKIYSDAYVQSEIITEGLKVWSKIRPSN